MVSSNLFSAVLFSAATVAAQELLTDITQIQRYWGQISTYADKPENYFGVDYVGLPNGCQIVSILPLLVRRIT